MDRIEWEQANREDRLAKRAEIDRLRARVEALEERAAIQYVEALEEAASINILDVVVSARRKYEGSDVAELAKAPFMTGPDFAAACAVELYKVAIRALIERKAKP